MSTTPAPDSRATPPDAVNPYERYYLEQAALLSTDDPARSAYPPSRDLEALRLESVRLESFRLAPLARGDDGEPRPLRRQDVVLVSLSVVVLLVIPLVIATVCWRMSTTGS